MECISQYLTSLEVSEMVNKNHRHMLRDIDRYISQIEEINIENSTQPKIGLTETTKPIIDSAHFFIESSYKDSTGRNNKCYNITKKGCEFIAHKLTGTRGTEFTAKYINRFHEMEEKLVSVTPKAPEGAELLALAVLEAQKMIEEKDRQIQEQSKQIEEMIPAKVFTEAVSASSTSILVREMAKLLNQNGVDTGEKRLYSKLREEGYLIKRAGSDYNLPTQRSMELGLFEIKETAITHSDGNIRVTKTTKVTGKGQVYFINKYSPSKDLIPIG